MHLRTQCVIAQMHWTGLRCQWLLYRHLAAVPIPFEEKPSWSLPRDALLAHFEINSYMDLTMTLTPMGEPLAIWHHRGGGVGYQSRYSAIEALDLPETIPAMLERAKRLFGDGIAIDFFERGETLTFAALSQNVRRLASGLYQHVGIRRGQHVAVLLSNRIEYPLIWLALAELGAVMVPIVAGSSLREIGFFIDDSDADALIVENELFVAKGMNAAASNLPPAARTVIVGGHQGGCHNFQDLMTSGDPSFAVSDPPEAGDLLNIQYTSGTTGLPKGTMLSHRFWVIGGVVPILMWTPEARSLLSDGPFFYIDPQWMLIAGLYTGARVDFTERMSVRKWVGWLHDRKTELAWFTDPVLKNDPDPRERNLSTRLFLGYHMSPAMIAEAEDRFATPVREAYGMTEIGMGLAVPLEADDPDLIGTCGVPGPFRRCRIVRADGSDAEDDEAGELWIGGDGILDGYYNRPEANADLLRDGWFRTGDLFVRSAKGYYSIVGRLKDMVRRSGESIAAAEVEQVLFDLPGVAAVAVVAVPDEERGEEVKAYLCMAPGVPALTPEAVLKHCRDRLARFKVPRFLAFVDRMPRTASGKVAKELLIRESENLRSGAFDAVTGAWL